MNTERNYTIDFIKFFATYAVVCIHTRPFYGTTILGYDGTALAYIIDSTARFGVPFFFVVSGYFFGKRMLNNHNRSSYFKKYFIKTAMLYFSWTFFYLVYYCSMSFLISFIKHSPFYSDLLPTFSFTSVLTLISEILYFGYASVHLWYIIALLWSITILYFSIKFNKFNVLFIMSFFLNIIGLFGGSYKCIIHFPMPTRNALFFGLFYCALGCFFAFNENYLLKKIVKIRFSFIVLAFMLFTLMQIGERILLIIWFGGDITDNFFIATIPLTISLFMIVLVKRNIGQRLYITKIGENSLGIYAIHPFIINIISLFSSKIIHINLNSIAYTLLFTPFVFLTSYIAYEIIKKFKARFIPIKVIFKRQLSVWKSQS